MARPLVLYRLYLDDGTENFSDVTVNHPDRTYQGRVKSWGSIDRSIPVPAGLCQIGEASVTLIDDDQSVREFMAVKTVLRKLCELKVGFTDWAESDFLTAYIGEIIPGASFGPGTATIPMRDIHSRWLDHSISPLITRVGLETSFSGSAGETVSFPNLPLGTDEVFAPIVIGSCASPAANMQGVLRLQLVDTTLNRYVVARHACEDIPTVYKNEPGDEVFSIVDPGDYTIVEEDIEIEGITYTFTWLDFDEALPEGTEVRADVDGINFRGDFGELGAVSGVLRNPVDALINLIYYATLKLPVTERYALDTWAAIHAACEGLNLYCDYMITEPMVWRAVFTHILTGSTIDLFQNKTAQLALGLTFTDPSRPVFTDTLHILRNSESQKLADPTFNRIRYTFQRNHATGEWAGSGVFDNEVDQAAVGEIQETPLELPSVRDANTAAIVVAERARWFDLDAFQFECDMPAPEVLADMELAKLIGITHYGGIKEGGYTNEEFKVSGLRLDLDTMKMHVRCIRRVAD